MDIPFGLYILADLPFPLHISKFVHNLTRIIKYLDTVITCIRYKDVTCCIIDNNSMRSIKGYPFHFTPTAYTDNWIDLTLIVYFTTVCSLSTNSPSFLTSSSRMLLLHTKYHICGCFGIFNCFKFRIE